MTRIRVENLSVRFTSCKKNILNNISFEFNTDERILILGESGSGKSTLLLSLMGLIQRAENTEVNGDVFIGDKSVREMIPKDVCQRLGLVFQNPESQFCMLYPEDEVAFGLENLSMKPSLMQEVINKSLEDMGFPEKRYKNQINNLSGGQQQRLALASIFAQGAEMFLLDEPTANLDPKGRRQVVSSSKIATNKGKGLLVVEHNLEPWFPLLDRLIILNRDGTILDDGNPRLIFEKWGSKLGEMGIWRPYSVRIYEELKDLGYANKVPLNSHELIEQNIPKHILNEAFDRLRKNSCIKNNFELNNESIIDIQSLSAGYENEENILNGVELKVHKGDFFALVGSNGSGKSTLAKTLIHMVKSTGGTVKLLGKNLNDMNLRDICSVIGYVFQNPEHQFVEVTNSYK